MTDRAIEGGCLCGAVRFRITGEVLGFQYCHCSRCRAFTGSAHGANMFVAPDDFGWTQGDEMVGTWMLEAEPSFPTAFCKRCGSSMPSMSSTGKYWVVPAGGVEGDPGVRPARSIFWGSRAPWYEHVGDLPQHAEWQEDQ